jgi:hypothetical protein
MSVFCSLLGHLWALAKCDQLLTDIKKTRSTPDTSGICVSGYEQQVEVRANVKYDLCQRDILSRLMSSWVMRCRRDTLRSRRSEMVSRIIQSMGRGGRRT